MKQILLILMTIFALAANACNKEKFDPEAYKTEQRKYVIAKAELSPADAQRFFVIFDEMRTKVQNIFCQIRKVEKMKPQTDKEYRECIEKRDQLERDIKKVSASYHQKMFKALPPKKVYQALRAAEKFDRKQFMNNNYKGEDTSKNKKNVKK